MRLAPFAVSASDRRSATTSDDHFGDVATPPDVRRDKERAINFVQEKTVGEKMGGLDSLQTLSKVESWFDWRVTPQPSACVGGVGSTQS